MENLILNKLEAIEHNSLLASKKLFSFEEAVLFTGMKKTYLYKLTCTKQIPYYKPNGGHVYFDKEDLEKWMRRNRFKTNDEVEQESIIHTIKKGGAL